VNYSDPSAFDQVDGPVLVTCLPASGGVFPLGSTHVECRASDSSGNTAATGFEAEVVDTTAPGLVAPAPVIVSSIGDPVPASHAAVIAFLASATASDLVTLQPSVTNDAPAFFPLGATQVTFTASDAAGNTTSATSSVTVVTSPVTPTPPADTTPPGNVTSVSAKSASRLVTLTWKLPADDDFDHVVVSRGTTAAGAANAPVPVYSGRASKMSDRGLRNGTEYRYLIVSYDEAGNASTGVAVGALPKALLLLRPKDGAVVTAVPRLVWARVARATYYNVQLYRGDRKWLSAWPGRSQLRLASRWRFNGHSHRLSLGSYSWYVWPGYGRRSAAKYGALLGQSTFAFRRK
jgi:hypothetical protein